MDTITETIEKNYRDLDIISSDVNAAKLIIRIRMIYNESQKKLTKEQIHSEEILKNLENALLKDLSLKGIQDIKKVYVKEAKRPTFDKETGAYTTEKSKEWVIETDGTNLFEVFLIDEVDFTRTLSNDINEIYDCLGIEAVRKALINELRAVLRPYDVYVNYRHIAILCDVMTQRGLLTAITRHGLNRVELGPLRKCSFEETVEILLDAGLFSETDYLAGITENIMCGQLAPFGTGCFDLLLDMNKITTARLIDEAKLMENEEDLLNTPLLMSSSPPQTPYMQTPGQMNVPMTSYLTPGPRQSPSFTPLYPSDTTGFNKSPVYIPSGITSKEALFINTPNPMLSPGSISSPVYNPSEYYKTPGPYSPLRELEDIYQTHPNAESQYSQATPGYYSPSGPSKSPYMVSGGMSSLHKSTSPHYSPSSPHYKKGFIQTTTPGKIINNNLT
jgi:DNA-directed RNA polymerase II subunit RPB1